MAYSAGRGRSRVQRMSTKSPGNEPWREANSKLEAKYNVKTRSRSVPETDVPLLGAAKAQPLSAPPKAAIAPG